MLFIGMKKEIRVHTHVSNSIQSRPTIKLVSLRTPTVQGLRNRTEIRPRTIARTGKQALSKNGTMEKILQCQVSKITRHQVVVGEAAPLEWSQRAVITTELSLR